MQYDRYAIEGGHDNSFEGTVFLLFTLFVLWVIIEVVVPAFKKPSK